MTVLYVDDDPDDRELFCEAVDQLTTPMVCITASDGHEALKILTKQRVDIIFLDYRMPEMDGGKFLQEVSGMSIVKPRIYVYSTHMLDFEKEKCLNYGATECFEKPGSVEEIASLIRKVIP